MFRTNDWSAPLKSPTYRELVERINAVLALCQDSPDAAWLSQADVLRALGETE